MRRLLPITTLVFASLLTAGCMSNLQGDTYSRDEARRIQTIRYAIVEDVRMVAIEGTQSGIGAGAGAVVGGVAGSTVGGGKGQTLATVAGALAGGLLGAAAEKSTTKTQGVEIVVKFEDNNQIISVVQGHDPAEVFNVGDRVRISNVSGTTRVSH
jgi:outer membrane lipoprotein SlyB